MCRYCQTLIALLLLGHRLVLDLAVENPFTGRAPFEIGVFGTLSVCWLGSFTLDCLYSPSLTNDL